MELRHLRYFVAAAEEENLTRAAERLNISQPPLSRQIRDLEEELCLELFQREAKSIRIAPAGRVFLEHARAVLDRAEEAIGAARALAQGVSDELHIGFAPSLTVEILPRALRRFGDMQKGTKAHLYDLSTEEMLARLRDGSIDVALLIKPNAKALRGLAFTPVKRNAVCVAFHPSHALRKLKRVSLEQVANERIIAYSKKDYPEYHAWLSALFERKKLTPRVAEEHEGSTGLIASVESGRGVALVQQGFESLSGPRLTLRPISPAPPPFVVGFAIRKDAASSSIDRFKESVEWAVSDLRVQRARRGRSVKVS